MNQLKTIAEKVRACINERLLKIDYSRDKYDCNICSNGNIIYVWVKYDNVEFLRIYPIISPKEENGRTIHYGLIHVSAIDDAPWYNNPLTHIKININENMTCDGKPLKEVLNERLPLVDNEEKRHIESVLNENGIIYKNICFDTINYRYVITLRPQLNDYEQALYKGNYVYKYTTLETFLKIAKNKKYRLNSIISMNDTSEAFFLGDYLLS